jgi:ribonuclease P protein component
MTKNWDKASRIRKSRDFRWVQRKGKKWKSADFLFLFLPTRVVPFTPIQSRIGLVVSKKVGNAVVRNLVKRRIREACRKNLNCIKGNIDIVVIAFSSAANCHQNIVDDQVINAFNGISRKLKMENS